MKNECESQPGHGLSLATHPRKLAGLATAFGTLCCRLMALAEEPAATPPGGATKEVPAQEQWSVHFQATVIPQGHGHFNSPYEGKNSIASVNEIRTSYTSTLFLGGRLWQGAELFVNPELSGGRGIGGVVGIAGFPNGDIARVGKPEPTVSLARLFLRQTVGLGGEQERLASEPNQAAGSVDVSRLTFTAGKYSANDLFDDNAYSHDPRTQFMNWALMDNGAWDYPADTRGYTWGGAVELNQPRWALRYGLFGVPKEANGLTFDHHLDKAHSHNLELGIRYQLAEHPGTARVLGYWTRAHMGNYRHTLDTPAFNLDITRSRTYSSKYGFGLSVEQELTKDLGAFMRVGWNDGHTESWMFTEIDQTASLGLSLKGTSWHRPGDVFGLAGLANGLSEDHKDYLAAGGNGFLLGDGRLNYAPEETLETYYLFKITKWFSVTADYQFISHPGYNADRGPVHVGAVRIHAEF